MESVAQLEKRVQRGIEHARSLEATIAEKSEKIRVLNKHLDQAKKDLGLSEQRERSSAAEAARWRRIAEARGAVLQSLGQDVNETVIG